MIRFLCSQPENLTSGILVSNLISIFDALGSLCSEDVDDTWTHSISNVITFIFNIASASKSQREQLIIRLAANQLPDIQEFSVIKGKFSMMNNSHKILALITHLFQTCKVSKSTENSLIKQLRLCLELPTTIQYLSTDQQLVTDIASTLLRLLKAKQNLNQETKYLRSDIAYCLASFACFIDKGISAQSLNSKGGILSNNGHVVALQELQLCLRNENIEIVGCAMNTVRKLLETKNGVSAFKDLEENVQSVLNVFMFSSSISTNKKWKASKRYSSFDDPTIWTLHEKTVEVWIKNLVNSILCSCETDDYYVHIGRMFEFLPDVAEKMMPYIFHAALLNEINNPKLPSFSIRREISTKIDTFLKNVTGNDNQLAAHCLLRVFEFLRTQKHPLGEHDFHNNFWLEVSFFRIAEVAIDIQEWESSLIFLEIEQSSKIWPATDEMEVKSFK
ncbi:hypothetical protein HK096_010420, partial [Nowakowskiella sp. JEL0078]